MAMVNGHNHMTGGIKPPGKCPGCDKVRDVLNRIDPNRKPRKEEG